MRKLLILAVMFCPAAFGYASFSGFCEQGGVKVTVAGQTSPLTFMQSYPNLNQSAAGPHVTVYLPGTTTKPGNIYSDNSGTVLANPFPCTTAGQFLFFADNGLYDVLFSGTGITPFTRGSMQGIDPNTVAYIASQCSGLSGDAAACINTALAASPTYGTVQLPPGTYTISSATITIPTTVCLKGSGQANTTVSSSGAFAAVTILNAASACLADIAVRSARDGILIAETGATCNSNISTCAQYDRIENVTVSSWGSTYAGIHVTSTTCCVYNPIFDNVNVLGPGAAPSVATRSDYLFDGTSGFTLFTDMKNGRITNGFRGLNLLNFQQGRIDGLEVDGITNDTMGAGGGTAVALNCGAGCAYNDFKLIYEGLGSGGNIDINASFDAASYSNWLTSIGFVAANTSRLVDNGTINCLWGAGGGGAVPDYCLTPRSFGNVTIPSTYVFSMPGVINNQFIVNGGQTSDQLSGVGCLMCIQAPNTNFGYPLAMMADSSGRGISMVTQGFSAAGTTGTTMLMSPSAGIIYAGTGGTVGLPLPFNSGLSIDQSGSGVFFASLGTPANGTIRYCKNCKNVIDDSVAAGAACAGSGSGAVARRENGHWACN